MPVAAGAGRGWPFTGPTGWARAWQKASLQDLGGGAEASVLGAGVA